MYRTRSRRRGWLEAESSTPQQGRLPSLRYNWLAEPGRASLRPAHRRPAPIYAPDTFNYLETDPEKQGGMGLGLAIVKTFVEAHDGVVTVESELGVGSTFRFSLPGQ